MKSSWKIFVGLTILALVGAILVWPVGRTAEATVRTAGGAGPLPDDLPTPVLEGVTVSGPVTPTLTIAVRDLPELVLSDLPELVREMHRETDYDFEPVDFEPGPHENPLAALQLSLQPAAPGAFGTPILNFAGMDYNIFPPDTTGDVGPNHYLQAVNGSSGSTVRIYDKSGNILKTFAMETLAPSSPCNNGYCDPIVLYDELADRWVITEFSAATSNPMCIYVSQTADPMGSWWLYSFDLTGYDYPKYGVWWDAYYMGYNGGPSGYRQVVAFDRNRMLAGQAATMQTFNIPYLSAFSFQLLLPAGLEGKTAPPAGAPAIFARVRDTEIHGPAGYSTTDLMEMWELHIDWTTPANSTLTQLPSVQIAEFDHSLCGTSGNWNCMPQPGTTQRIDPIREPLHFPLQYRNFGTHETLVGCFAEDVDGTDHAAVHWFELRRTPPGSGSWVRYQEGVLGGEAGVHRSVCSAAMDSAGSIAVGYTRTGSNTPYYPSIYYAGRRPWDPLGTMPFYEYRIIDGVASQTANERWGDYAGIGVDPADGCTIWFTSEYEEAGPSSDTQVAAFRFDPDFKPDASPDSLSICAPNSAIYTVNVAKTCALNGTVTMSTSGLPAGVTQSWSVNPVTPNGNTTLTIGNTGAATPGTYSVNIIGTHASVGSRQETVTLNIATAAPGAATLSAPANYATGVALSPNLTWNALSGAASYDVQIATDPAFSNIVRSASGLTATSYTPSPALDAGTVYYWRVRGNNACGGGTYSNVWAFRTATSGCTTYTSTDVPKTIPNPGTVNSSLTIGDATLIQDVNVTIGRIDHLRDQDLDIYIRHPDNTQVELTSDNGGNGDNYVNTVFDDEAATPITSGSPPFTGSYRPEGSLSAFDGKSASGTWVLTVTDDNATGTAGTLQSWSIEVCGVNNTPTDYSDLSTTYGVASHRGNGVIRLGANWDADDSFGPPGSDDADDDGVTLDPSTPWQEGATVRLYVDVTAASGTYYVAGWFDWNDDGDFADTGEKVIGRNVTGATPAYRNTIQFTIPNGVGYTAGRAVNGRFRLYASEPTREPMGNEQPYGDTSSGEVEDSRFQPRGPTAVTVTDFRAATRGSDVRLMWATTSELDLAGFNLYRSTRADGPYVQLNSALIAAQRPGSPIGATYTWLDRGLRLGRLYYYRLEQVNAGGATTLYGPLEVRVGERAQPAPPMPSRP